MAGRREREIRFLADVMLGRLAKWLRVLGHDTLYGSGSDTALINRSMAEGRCLISRQEKKGMHYPDVILVHSDHVGEQLSELKKILTPGSGGPSWFSRCLRCNTRLEKAKPHETPGRVPDYIRSVFNTEVRFCPACERYFWPGSHRTRMIAQLEAWGFKRGPESGE